MAFYSGKVGFVNVNGTACAFGKWKMNAKIGKPKIPNWKGQGFMNRVAGLYDGSFTIEGPWDVGNMPLTAGLEYVFQFGVSAGIFLTVDGIIDVEFMNDVEDTPRLAITGETNGAFTINVL